jgi:hypothetical protein
MLNKSKKYLGCGNGRITFIPLKTLFSLSTPSDMVFGSIKKQGSKKRFQSLM